MNRIFRNAVVKLFLTILLLPLAALAQPAADSPVAQAAAAAVRAAAQADAKCAPGAAAVAERRGVAGAVVWVTYYCRPADRYAGWLKSKAAAHLPSLAEDVQDKMVVMLRTGDIAGLAALRDTNLSDPRLQPAVPLMTFKPVPAGPWVVAKNGASNDRPTRAIAKQLSSTGQASYTLGASLSARATVGARCSCSPAHVISSSATWCQVAGQAAGVGAVCSEVAQ